jgi:RNA polymerase sigma-70 factor, ECF subfamily
MTGNPHDAQDVVQESLLYASRELPRYRRDAQFGTWLTRIVINRCHNLRRDSRPTDPLPEDDSTPSTPGAETVVVHQQRSEATMAAIAELPFDQRAALVLHTFGGCTHAEVACILGITENTAKVRVHRARRALTIHLQTWG